MDGEHGSKTVSRVPPVLIALALSALAGCATRPPTIYQWENYQRQLYEYMKSDGTNPTEQLAALQAQAEKARAGGAVLPPGFRAHLAMVNLRLGRHDEARQMIEGEKAAFPESAPFMDFVLKSMGEKKS
jgi:hypothetical protein